MISSGIIISEIPSLDLGTNNLRKKTISCQELRENSGRKFGKNIGSSSGKIKNKSELNYEIPERILEISKDGYRDFFQRFYR